MKATNTSPYIEKDEVNLRELFSIIFRYKWSIIFFTIIITLGIATKVYFMPKYYKSTVTLEVKSEDKAGSFSMGAAALLLGGGNAGGANLDKDISLFKMYRTNSKVLDKINGYMIRYFIKDEKNKELEIDSNLSIEVTDVKINHFKDYGIRLKIQYLNSTQYTLLQSKKSLGIYHYSEMVHLSDFSLMVHQKRDSNISYTIALAGTKRYVYEKIIKENLSIQADKKSPFLTLSFLDNLPHRGEAYLKSLIEIYTQQSINDIKGDASTIINSYDKQLKKIEQKVAFSSKNLENFKIKNNIVSVELQASALIKELSQIGIEIAQNNYKQELLNNLLDFAENHQNINAIASSLIELKDEPTISLIKLIQEQQLALADYLIKYKPSHPTIIRTEQTIYNLKDKVLSNLSNLQKTLENKTQSLENMEKGYIKKLKSAPKKEQKLMTFSRDYKVNEKMYLYLMQERSSAQLKHDKALSRYKIIEKIYTSDNAAKPKKALIVIVAFITTLILMIFISLLREFMRKSPKVKDIKEDG